MARRRTYNAERTPKADRDLDELFDFLFSSYEGFGDRPERAFERASDRVERIKAEMRALAKRPHQGTLHPGLLPHLRSVTKDRVIFYFTVDDEAPIVRVLAIFFGSQDHLRHMLKRLLEE